jgi:hypothetical protein
METVRCDGVPVGDELYELETLLERVDDLIGRGEGGPARPDVACFGRQQ